MSKRMQRKTLYFATIVAMIAMVGGWALAATSVSVSQIPQTSNVTVVTPTGATVATVQSGQMIEVTGAIAGSAAAGTQEPGQNGLNSTIIAGNAMLGACATVCSDYDYAAVQSTAPLTLSDEAEQVVLQVAQPGSAGTPIGFDVQVEVQFSAGTPVFGSGYFDTTVASGATPATLFVYLFVDLGTPDTAPPQITSVVVTLNNCLSATVCP